MRIKYNFGLWMGLGFLILPLFIFAAKPKVLTPDDVIVSAGKIAEDLREISKSEDPTRPSSEYIQGMPFHLRFKFDDDVLKGNFNPLQRQLLIIPLRSYRTAFPKAQRKTFDRMLDFLKGIIQRQTGEGVSQIPVFPRLGGAQLFHSQTMGIEFQHGSGVRFITRFGTEETPTTNENIFYTFQGVTKDGHTLVCFFYPISARNLPISEHASIPSMYMEQLAPESFSPDIEKLDAVVKSITFRQPSPK